MEITVSDVNKLILLTFLISVKGEIFTPGRDKGPYVVCLDKGEPLQLANPFDPAEKEDEDFILLQWLRKENVSAEETSLMYWDQTPAPHFEDVDHISLFQFWGIQIDPVTYEDSGIYRAALLSLDNSKAVDIVMQVVVASPPTMVTESLDVKIEKVGNQKTVKCGQVYNLGSPPIELVLKAGNGTILATDYDNGYISLQLNSNTDTGEFHCGIEESSPAKACIPVADLGRWDSSIQIGGSTSSADSTGIIAGIAVGIVLLLIIIGVVLIIVKKRSKSRDGKAYNTKSEEAKAAGSDIPLQHQQHHTYSDDDDDGDRSQNSSSVPYLSSKQSSASPYMVTGLKMNDYKDNNSTNHYQDPMAGRPQQGSNSRAPIYKQPPVVQPENDDIIDLAPAPVRKDRNRNMNSNSQNLDSRKSWAGVVDSFKDRQQQQQQQEHQPPVPMKRTKHLAASSEGLNLDHSGRGGGGGGENVGTLV